MISFYLSLAVVIFLLIILLAIMFRLLKLSSHTNLQEKIEHLKEEITQYLMKTQDNLFETQKNLTEHLTKLYKEIGNINQESSQILNLTKSFHQVLTPTKKRGIFGEVILENIIKDILPKDIVIPQHTFSNGKRVDFLIKLPQGSLPVDAKFSLDSFRNYVEASSQDKESYKKIFLEGFKRRIDECKNYILPQEGTLDFSFMYVPSEAVYYFIITETNLLDYAYKNRVFIVGPNNFYVYLQTLLVGMKALKVEERAKIIYNILKQLEVDIEKILQDYGILGTHLKSAAVKYEEVKRNIERMHSKIVSAHRLKEDEDKS